MWVLRYSRDFTLDPDTPAASTLALIGLACAASTNYYIAGGRLRSHRNPGSVPVLYLAGSDSDARHKVVIVADAPSLTTAANQNEATNILGVTHYAPSPDNLFLCGGFSGGTNYGPINGINYAIPGNVINIDSNNIANPVSAFTITLSDTFSDGSTVDLEVITNGNTKTVTGDTHQPLSGLAGLYLSSKDAAQTELQGIRSLDIYGWVPMLDVGPTGTATASGTTLSMPAPTYTAVNAGDTINYSYKQTAVYNAVPSAIAGKSGSVIAPAVIPALSWAVPGGSQNKEIWIVCEVDDGVTTFAAQGYFNGVADTGNNGVYTPAFVAAPVPPNNAALLALYAPSASGKVIWGVVGDSISWQWSHATDQIQPLLNTIYGAGKVLCINGGNRGTLITDWYNSVVPAFASQSYSQIPGYDTYNNFYGLYNAIVANYVPGDSVVISTELGSNFPAPIGTYLTDMSTLINQLVAAYATIVAGQPAPIVIHDLPTYRYNQYQVIQGTIYDPLIAYFRTLVGGTVHTGDTHSRPFFMTNNALMDPDGFHPNTTTGNDAVMRFDIAGTAPFFGATGPPLPGPIKVGSSISMSAPTIR